MSIFDKFGRQYTRRTKINTGYKCNLRCKFCYYYDRSCKFDEDFNEVKKQLDYAKKVGITMVDFSGGESTIHKDFLKIVAYAKKLGFKTVCTLTNGLAFSNMEYLKKAKEAGLNEILFSLHGTDKENHESITQVKGSYDKIIKAIKNAKKLGIKFRFNVTVSKINYKGLVKQARLINKLKPFQVNYIVFNEWRYGEKIASALGEKYSIMAPYIKSAIDTLKGIESINVRYIPYCFMKGYEKHVTGHLNLVYDNYEWFPRTRHKFECESRLRWIGVVLYSIIRFGSFDIDKNIMRLYEKLYVKPPQCKKCKLNPICDGFTKSYYNLHGGGEVRPYKLDGGYITDPLIFRETSPLPKVKKGITFIEGYDSVRGAAYSRNMQIKNAKTDILLIKDQDVEISDETIKKMKEALKEADIVYPRVHHKILKKEYIQGEPLRDSTCFMTRKSTLDKYNIRFDEKYFIYGEDNDFFIQCNLKGLKFKMVPDLVKHKHVPSAYFLKWRYYLTLRNHVYALRKWRHLDNKTRTLMRYPTLRGLLGRIRDLLKETGNPLLVSKAIFQGMRM